MAEDQNNNEPIEIDQNDTGEDTTTHDAQVDAIPVLPLRNVVFYPGQMMPLFVGRASSVRLIEEAYRNQTMVLVLTQKESARIRT